MQVVGSIGKFCIGIALPYAMDMDGSLKGRESIMDDKKINH
jgi:hypothetical protein